MFLKVKHYFSIVCMFPQKRCIHSLWNERQGTEFGECVSLQTHTWMYFMFKLSTCCKTQTKNWLLARIGNSMWLKFRQAHNCVMKSLKCIGKLIFLSPLEKLIRMGRTGILCWGFNFCSLSLLTYPLALSAGPAAFTCLSMTLFLLSASSMAPES